MNEVENSTRRITPMDSVDNSLNLSDLLELVRSELRHAEIQRQVKGQPPMFAVKTLDLELQVVLKETSKGSGKFDLKVVSAGGETVGESGTTHTIKLHLEALSSNEDKQEDSSGPRLGLLQTDQKDHE